MLELIIQDAPKSIQYDNCLARKHCTVKSPEFTPDEDIVSIDLVDEGKMLMFILLRFFYLPIIPC